MHTLERLFHLKLTARAILYHVSNNNNNTLAMAIKDRSKLNNTAHSPVPLQPTRLTLFQTVRALVVASFDA